MSIDVSLLVLILCKDKCQIDLTKIDVLSMEGVDDPNVMFNDLDFSLRGEKQFPYY